MNNWTKEDIILLCQKYGDVPNSKLDKLFPERSRLAIYKKAYKLGLRKTPDIEFLDRSEAKRGERSANWKGGIRKTTRGYRQVHMPGHPRADTNGYVMEHIFVWEEKTGVPVPENCCVHHLNGDKSDNRIENLCLMQRTAHTVFHHTGLKRSEETRKKISDAAKERFLNAKNHPSYKEIDIAQMTSMRKSGMKVEDICQRFGIAKTTYYRKMEEQANA